MALSIWVADSPGALENAEEKMTPMLLVYTQHREFSVLGTPAK